MITRTRGLTLHVGAIVALLFACFLASNAGATSSNVTVTLDVPSLTSIDLAGCPPSAQALGSALPGSTVTTADCEVSFGATGFASRLRIRQSDGAGAALHSRTVSGSGDPTFGTNGVSNLSVTGDWRAEMHVLADGKILHGGDTGSYWRAARVDTDGTLDMSYGGGDGIASWHTGNSTNHAHTSEIFPDGSMVIAGHILAGSVDDVGVVKFTPDGDVDTSWGTAGSIKFQPYPSGSSEEPYDVHALPDGSLLLAGMSYAQRWWVAKLDPSGQLDTSFGGGDGIFVQHGGGSVDYGHIVVDGPSGAIYWTGKAAGVAFIAKLTASGELDTSWGDGGVKSINVSGTTQEYLLHGFIDSQGRLVVYGDDEANADFAFTIRLTTAGQLDTTFGSGGIAKIDPFGSGEVWLDSGGFVAFEDDRYCTSGNGQPSGSWRFVVYCFDADGTLDEDFGGGNGYVAFTASSYSSNYGGFDYHDGKLYVGGGSSNILVTIRVGDDTQTVPDYVHPTTTFASAGGAFGACLRTTTNASASWTPGPAGSCAGDGVHWNGVPPTSAAAGAEVATASAGELDARAVLRFGVKVPAAAAGSFVAPLTFEVLAP